MRIVLLLLLLTGCAATSANYNAGLKRWVGQPELELYQQWGTPGNVLYLTPDQKVITYTHIDVGGPVNGQSRPYENEVYYPAIDNDGFGYPSDGNYKTYYCRTSFTITNGFVSDYTFNGDDCVARKK